MIILTVYSFVARIVLTRVVAIVIVDPASTVTIVKLVIRRIEWGFFYCDSP